MEEDPVLEEEEVWFDCFAKFWKASKLFGPDSTALIEKTMPAAQCPVWPQYPQTGAVCGYEFCKFYVNRWKSIKETNIVDGNREGWEISGVGSDRFANGIDPELEGETESTGRYLQSGGKPLNTGALQQRNARLKEA